MSVRDELFFPAQNNFCFFQHLVRRIAEAERKIDTLTGSVGSKDAALILKDEEIDLLMDQVNIESLLVCVCFVVCE